MTLTRHAESHVLFVHLAMIEFRMEMKMASIAVVHVLPVRLAMMTFRIKMKMASIAEDHVLLFAPLARMKFKIKMKLASIAEETVQIVVRKQFFYKQIKNTFCPSNSIF